MITWHFGMALQLDQLPLRRRVRQSQLDAHAGGEPGRGRGRETGVRGQRRVGMVPLRTGGFVVARPLAYNLPFREYARLVYPRRNSQQHSSILCERVDIRDARRISHLMIDLAVCILRSWL